MEFARWCRAGVSYAIFDHDGYNYEGDNYKYINAPSTASWPHAPGLQARVLYSANAVDVLAVSPCSAALAPVERTR
jgi:hypothetical protein